MRRIGYTELMTVEHLNNDRLKVLRQRDCVAIAFGQANFYESSFLTEVDAAANRLNMAIARSVDRELAAKMVRDLWGAWMRVLAMAEDLPPNVPTFFYVIRYQFRNGDDGWIGLGSMLDTSATDDNLRKVAKEVHSLTGTNATDVLGFNMTALLAAVRKDAKAAGYDWSDRFLPPFGSKQLDELLHDPEAPDRVIVTTPKQLADRSERARRAGILARAKVEASLPPKERLQ
jgi:hypothetical protein